MVNDTQSLAETVLDPLTVPTDRLYRVSPDVYHKMTRFGLLTEHDKVVLLDGLIVRKAHCVETMDMAARMYRFPLDVYHGMLEHGLLTEHDKVVLLDGLLVAKMTRGPRHSTSTRRVVKALERLPLEGWHIRKEEPILLPAGPGVRDSEPEPDAAVVRGDDDLYVTRHPGPADIALVVEVADNSLREDRAGLAVYARAGIPVAWLVNLKDRAVEVHTRPPGPARPASYGDTKVYGPDDHLPVVVDGREVGWIAVRDVLP